MLKSLLYCADAKQTRINGYAMGMKAIRIYEFGGPEVLRFEDTPDPAPGAGQVLVKVHAVGVNPVDTYIRSGAYGRERPLPYTPGGDAAGVVEATGAGVTAFKVGDRVYTGLTVTGAYAEKTVADAGSVYALPENVAWAEAAGVNVPYATAYRALLQRAGGQAGETVLVHGASGGVGIAATQIARSHGFVVAGTAGTPDGLALISREGAQFTANHRSEGYLETLKASATGGRGFDIILEMLANVNLGHDLPALAPGGRVIVIGSRGPVEITPRDLMGRDADIRGMSLFNATPADLWAVHAALFAGLANGTLRPVVSRQMPLAQAREAHVAVMSPDGGTNGKIVLLP